MKIFLEAHLALDEAFTTATAPVVPGEDSGLPAEVAGFLAHLRLLETVPFQYLVPDDDLLPPESIRFFYLDRNWTDANFKSYGTPLSVPFPMDAAAGQARQTARCPRGRDLESETHDRKVYVPRTGELPCLTQRRDAPFPPAGLRWDSTAARAQARKGRKK